MTMSDPQGEARGSMDAVIWLQDQVTQLKTAVVRMQQQNDQVQAATLDVNEKLRDAESRLREMSAKAVGLPAMQDQLRQLSGLMERIQDAEVLIDTKFEMLERLSNEERGRDQAEKNDLYRRIQDLERRSESLAERQSVVDDATRRFQEEVSRSHLQYQSINQRLEGVESKTGRNLDAVNRMEQAHSGIEQAIRVLRREDDVLAERTRLAHEVAARLETELHTQQRSIASCPCWRSAWSCCGRSASGWRTGHRMRRNRSRTCGRAWSARKTSRRTSMAGSRRRTPASTTSTPRRSSIGARSRNSCSS